MTKKPAENGPIEKPIADYLPLSQIMYHMLICLTDDSERHGYAITMEVAERTRGAIDLDPGTCYGYLKKMLKAGLIYESDERPDEDDNRRRYYRLSDLGQKVVLAEYQRIKDLERASRLKGVTKLKEA